VEELKQEIRDVFSGKLNNLDLSIIDGFIEIAFLRGRMNVIEGAIEGIKA